MKKRQSESGFSVLEAMVAMAVLSAGLLPLLALQGQFVNVVERIERVETRLSAERQALEIIKITNFIDTPDTQVKFDNYTIKLEATLVAGPRVVRDSSNGQGRFNMNLFDVTVKIIDEVKVTESFVVRDVEWEEIGGILDGL